MLPFKAFDRQWLVFDFHAFVAFVLMQCGDDLVRVRWLTGDQAGARRALSEFARLFPKDPRLPALTAQVQAPPADNNFTGGMGS